MKYNKVYLLWILISMVEIMFSNSVRAEAQTVSDYIDMDCKRYILTEKNLLTKIFVELKNSSFTPEEFFQVAACHPRKVNGGVKSPILHLTAEAPCTRIEYPKIIYNFYKKENPTLWEKIVNSKNTNGETYLDFIETLDDQEEFNTDSTKECAKKLIEFACKTGGKYSKYDKKCPTE